MGWFSQRSPQDAAMPYLNDVERTSRETYNPYIQRGEEAGGSLGRNFNAMSNDPTALINKIMEQYNESPAYQAKRNKALGSAYNAAAYGGNVGGAGHQEASADLVNSLMGEDMQQWLQNALGIQKTGLEGQQGLYNTGFAGSQNLGSDLTNLAGTKAQLAYRGQNDKNNRSADLLKSGIGAIGAIGAAPMTEGGSLAAYIGSKLYDRYAGGGGGSNYGGQSGEDWSNPFGHSWNARG